VSAFAGLGIFLPMYLRRMSGQAPWQTWSMVNLPSVLLSAAWATAGVYSVLAVLVYAILAVHCLHRLFREFQIVVRPLHPDQAGGLAPLGQFALRLSYLITLVGVALVITPVLRYYLAYGVLQFAWTRDILLGMACYAVAAPVAFFAPLAVAHSSMKQAKEELLMHIHKRFEAEYAKVRVFLDQTDSNLGDSLQTVNQLRTLHRTASQFPVWPFNVENLARFTTSFVSPLAIALLTAWVGGLLGRQ
jgi:hypothetical protein